ncbi:MAG: hypothetical protein HQ594_04015 [Candidatus Omnitrophica bacterium]|nr:hypothetical protein [Candidatus Omnitrophota bacterium]
MKSITYLILSIFLVTCAGCGYKYGSMLPEGTDSVHVASFINGIDPAQQVTDRRADYSYWPGLETDLTKRVIGDFIVDGNLKVKSEKKAALLLVGTLVDFRLLPLSYDTDENVDEQRVEIYVDLELYDNITGKLLWKEDNFMGHTNYEVSDTENLREEDAVREAVKDISRRIVERVTEAW